MLWKKDEWPIKATVYHEFLQFRFIVLTSSNAKCFDFSFKMTKSVDSGNLSIRLTYLSMITVGLPLSAFVFCIAASLVYHSKESTSTHCKVINYLPSVSTSIGNFAPQKYVWRVALGLHSTPRYLLAYLHFILVHSDQLTFTFSFIEITCLLGLSFVSSIDDFGEVHFKNINNYQFIFYNVHLLFFYFI